MLSSAAPTPSADSVAEVVLAVLGPALVLVLAWLLLSVALTVLAASAARARRPTLARCLGSLALPAVRRLVERTAAVSVAVSLATSAGPAAPVASAGSAAGAGDAPTPLEEPVVRGPEGGAAPPTTAPPPDPSTPPTRSEHDEPRDAPPPAPARPGVHVVAVGDNLWSVAERVLVGQASADGRSDAVDDSTIARYWSRLIDLNRTNLRSGDPDLVFPGERLTLPPI